MLLNCDLGESYGERKVGLDEEVMPHIHQANIACGFHGGDPQTMSQTLDLAARHRVAVGAHPSYPDLEGFGRRSMALTAAELIAVMHYQVAALEGMAISRGLTLSHIKPHGALYNDMMRDTRVRAAVIAAVASYHRPLPLMLQATSRAGAHQQEARSAGVELLFEAFADRCYADDGSLLPRSRAGAVHDQQRTLQQVAQLTREGSVTTHGGQVIALRVDTLCVHGDNMAGVHAIRAIRALVDGD